MKKIKNLVVNLCIVAVVAALGLVALWPVEDTETFAPMRGGSTPKTVALTVNVYLNTECVLALADTLAGYGQTATFFLGGCWVAKNAETLQKLVQSGFCIGSHGYSHYDHSKLSYQENLAEMQKATDLIEGLSGRKIHLFAPPSGAYSTDTLRAAETLSHTVVMWTKDTIDWRDQDVEVIVKRATQNMGDGEVILLHPTPATVQALPRIIESYLAHGYRFVTVEDML